MDDLDPATAASLDDLAACLRHVRLLADQPTYRALEQQTARAGGLLPGTRLKRVRLTRTTVSDVLLGRKFPGKRFLLTFVDACGVDLENDRRWEQAWDRLAVQYQQTSTAGEVEKLRQENEELRRQLSDAQTRIDQAQASASEAIRRAEADADAAVRAAEARIAETERRARGLASQVRADAEAFVRAAEADRDQARAHAEQYYQYVQQAQQQASAAEARAEAAEQAQQGMATRPNAGTRADAPVKRTRGRRGKTADDDELESVEEILRRYGIT